MTILPIFIIGVVGAIACSPLDAVFSSGEDVAAGIVITVLSAPYFSYLLAR